MIRRYTGTYVGESDGNIVIQTNNEWKVFDLAKVDQIHHHANNGVTVVVQEDEESC